MSSTDFALFGPGRLGLQLARKLIGVGWSCTAIRGRSTSGSEHCRSFPGTTFDTWLDPQPWAMPGFVLVCVSDPQIMAVSKQINNAFDVKGSVILHTSGLHRSDALETCRVAGAAVASWHPLQTFSATGPPADLAGVPCAVEGSPQAVEAGAELAQRLGMIPWEIDPDIKPLYHATAAMAGNLTYILANAATELMAACGLARGDGNHPLRPLIQSSVNTALDSTGLEGLTGAIARRDLVAVRRHIAALPTHLARAYAALDDHINEHRRDAELD